MKIKNEVLWKAILEAHREDKERIHILKRIEQWATWMEASLAVHAIAENGWVAAVNYVLFSLLDKEGCLYDRMRVVALLCSSVWEHGETLRKKMNAAHGASSSLVEKCPHAVFDRNGCVWYTPDAGEDFYKL